MPYETISEAMEDMELYAPKVKALEWTLTLLSIGGINAGALERMPETLKMIDEQLEKRSKALRRKRARALYIVTKDEGGKGLGEA